MADLFSDALKQTPSLTVLVIVVWLFLRHLKERDAAIAEVFRQINDANHEARQESRAIIARNSEVIEKNTAAIARLSY